jgi:serine/threonine protein kinase
VKESEEDSESKSHSKSLTMMSNYTGISKIDPKFRRCKLWLFIQMEYCPGLSLRTYLDNPKREASVVKMLNMFRKLLEGVKMIHQHGILHRDLK